jgi:hypothetical protein
MDSAGLCDICGKAGTLYTCGLCGRRVCQLCITVGGICKHCAGGRNIEADEKLVEDVVLREKGIKRRL